MSTTLIPPPLYAVVAGVAQGLIARRRKPARISGTTGTAIAVGSFAFSLTATRLFHERGTTEMPFHPEKATVLITDGPYAHTRNPMYLSLAGILVGHAVARRSVAALLPVAAFVAVVDRLQIPAEEAALSRLFGVEYAAYKAAVPRWIGPRQPLPAAVNGMAGGT